MGGQREKKRDGRKRRDRQMGRQTDRQTVRDNEYVDLCRRTL